MSNSISKIAKLHSIVHDTGEVILLGIGDDGSVWRYRSPGEVGDQRAGWWQLAGDCIKRKAKAIENPVMQ